MTAWYLTATFYEIDIPHYRDSLGDGFGDLEGALDLDYLETLGIDCVILVPSRGEVDLETAADGDSSPQSSDNRFEASLKSAQEKSLKVVLDLTPIIQSDTDLTQLARIWLDRGLDGVKIGMSPETEIGVYLRALQEIRQLIDTTYLGRVLIGAADLRPNELINLFSQEQDACHLVLQPIMTPFIFAAFQQENRTRLVDAIKAYPKPKTNSNWLAYLRNYQPMRFRWLNLSEQRWLGSQLSLDENGKITGRVATLVDNHKGKWLMAHAILISLFGTPQLFGGDEIGSDQPPTEPIAWPDLTKQLENRESMLNATRFLLEVRRARPEFQTGEIELWETADTAVLAYWRIAGEERTLCLYNLSSEVQSVYMHFPELGGGRLIDLLHEDKWWSLTDMLPPVLKMRPFASHWLHWQA